MCTAATVSVIVMITVSVIIMITVSVISNNNKRGLNVQQQTQSVFKSIKTITKHVFVNAITKHVLVNAIAKHVLVKAITKHVFNRYEKQPEQAQPVKRSVICNHEVCHM